jgi:predicted membrane channel-forming protein YqfA (hemolysin III family)
MNYVHTNNYYGPGLSVLLTVLFVALKLTGVIAWSWLWVLSPLWLPFVLVLFVVIVLLIVGALVYGIAAAVERIFR